MKEFNQLCRELEALDPLMYTAILSEKSARIIPALTAIAGNGKDGLTLYATFILGAVAADGRVTDEELLVAYPLMQTFFGDAVDLDDCRNAARELKAGSRELKYAVNSLVDLIGLLSDDLKDDIVTVCLMICAIDGKVSLKEKNWIKKLIR